MSALPATATAGAPAPADIPKNHPRGLYGLFFTEMWERFSYYGMRALLMNYMTRYHGMLPSDASGIYKWYTSLVYLMPLFGGMIADRWLGLQSSIIAGAVLMAIGHFLMAFEPLPVFYTALAFLVIGNGFFKPNISTIVGKMYFKNDPRRDGAFTIFYMAINVGAFISPIVCGWLRANMGSVPNMGFHWGFAAAGVGMLIGCLTFVVCKRRVIKDVEAAGNDLRLARYQTNSAASRQSAADEGAPGATGVGGIVSRLFPILFSLSGAGIIGYALWTVMQADGSKLKAILDAVMPIAYGGIFIWMSVTIFGIKGAARDKSTVIFFAFLFAVVFWMAFEQAGAALTTWAEYNTTPGFLGILSTSEYWQSVNAVLIVIFAPIFSKLWQRLGKHEPSTPTKMFAALGFMALAFVPMVIAAKQEARTTTRLGCEALPPQFTIADVANGSFGRTPDAKKGSAAAIVAPVDAARLRFDPAKKELVKEGVLGHYLVVNLLKPTVPADFATEVLGRRDDNDNYVGGLEDLAKRASDANPVVKKFEHVPAGFKLPWTGEELKSLGIDWNPATSTMTLTRYPEAPTRTEILIGGATPHWRDSLTDLEKASRVARVSGIWLFLQYLFATLGELCISPVGLSLVTKLAPLRFAALFMGVFLLASSLAQYMGGLMGEFWGLIAPTQFFTTFVWTSLIGCIIALILIKPLKAMMHDVR
jgi:POT family proton-dependent oligopeptide transporter